MNSDEDPPYMRKKRIPLNIENPSTVADVTFRETRSLNPGLPGNNMLPESSLNPYYAAGVIARGDYNTVNTVASVAIPGYAPIGGMVGAGFSLMNSDEDPPSDVNEGADMTGTDSTSPNKTLADVMSSTNKLNLASTGIAAAGAIGSLINEANAKPQVFAPVVKENTVSLDKSASAMENAIESSADKTFKTGLSYLMDRGVSPTSAVTAMSAGRDKTITRK